MAATNTTSNFNFNLTDFDKIPWSEEAHNNWHIIDAVLARYVSVNNVQGAWENALAVIVGQRHIDTDSDQIYEVLIAHTTPSTGTFAAARTANSSQWQSVSVDVTAKGAYAKNTAYSPNDFISDSGRYGVAQLSFTSNNIAATTALAYDADVTASNIVTLIDFGDAIAATHDTNTIATGGTPTATYNSTTSKFDFGLVTGATGPAGAGTFPGSSTDNGIVRFDGTGGTTFQNSGVLIDDSNLLSAPGGLAFDKGADIASASPLVIDTDGGMFDVTGTTGFSVMTVAANRLFVLQFDGILTMTHGAGTLDLPGNANITTAAGDSVLCYSTAENVVRVLSVTKTTAAAASATVSGLIEVATQTEVNTGTDTSRSVSPSTLADSNFVNAHNYLLNGNFTVAQRGVSFTSATTPANSDDTYLLDQWILLSDGNDIVDVTQGTDAAVGNGIYLQADIETVEKKFGFLQVIPNKDSQNLLSESDVVSLSFNALVSDAAKLSRIKAMVLSWTSTADAVTSDIVSAWQSEGTSPTVVSNWTIEGDSGDLGVTASDVRYKLENVAINASGVNNIAVFIWSDDVGTNDTAGSLFKLTNVQLEVGPKATAFAPRPFQQELDLCQYWMERIYSSTSSNQWLATGYADNTSSGFFRVPFHVPKKAIPTITYSAAADFRVWYTGGGFQETTAAAVPGNPYHSIYHASLDFTTASASLTAGDAIALSNDGTADRWIEASSEL
jgi:hypothetical protein